VAAIVVFDVTNRASLGRCSKWVDDLRQEAPEHCIICLTGNKVDLVDKREVTAEEMVIFAQKHNLSMVFETSAKTNYGMEDMIYEIALEIDSHKENYAHLFQ
jgi:Ras-related protein Rab-6A